MPVVDWDRVQELFQAVSALPLDERGAFLTKEAEGDPALRGEVESLLDGDEKAPGDFMRVPRRDPGAGGGDGQESPDPLIGQHVSQYRINGVIASGGMGTVYLAEQENPRRLVALKIMRAGIASKYALRHFELESQILARLRHVGVAQVFEAGTFSDDAVGGRTTPFFAMEYIPDARKITAYAEEHALTTRERLKLFAQVCDAAHYGHQKGVIHRDLKPANILVDATGRVRIIDFGVARATDVDVAVTTQRTDVGQLIGTLQYMSPEQCNADPGDLDVRTDVYSLGVVLFELLTGRMPYGVRTTNIYEATRTIRECSPERPSVINPRLRGDVETIVLKALEKERDRRYQSVGEFVADVRRYLNSEPIVARRPNVWYQLRLFARRRRAVFAALTVTAVALVLAVIVSTGFALRATRQRDLAELRGYAMDLSAADAAIQRHDLADAEERLDAALARLRAAGSPFSEADAWELKHMRVRLDRSLSRVQADEGPNTHVAYSPALRLAATIRAGYPGALKLWRIVDGATFEIEDDPVAALEGPGWQFTSVAFSPDGGTLAAGVAVDGTAWIQLWDLADPLHPSPTMRLRGHEQLISALVFDPRSGMTLASVADFDIKLWQPSKGDRPVATLRGHTRLVDALAFSPDGSYLASGSRDLTVRLWDVSDPERPRPTALLREHTDHIRGLAFDPGGTFLASASLDRTVILWDVGASIAEYERLQDAAHGIRIDSLRGHDGGINCVTFHPKFPAVPLLFTGALDNTVRVWQFDQARTLWTYPARADSWEVSECRAIGTLSGHRGSVNSLVIEPRGRWILSSSDDGTMRLWPPGPAPVVPTLEGHASSVTHAAFDPSGRWMISAAGDTRVRVWDLEAAEGVNSVLGSVGLSSAALSDDGTLYAAGSLVGVVILYRITTPKFGPPRLTPLSTFTAGDSTGAIPSVAISGDGRRLAAAVEDRVMMWDLTELRVPRRLPDVAGSERQVLTVSFLDDRGDRIVMGGGERDGRGWIDIREVDSTVASTEYRDLERAVQCVALRPDRRQLACGTLDGSIHVFDVDAERMGRHRVLRGHTGAIRGIAFHPDGHRIASASEDRTARIWDPVTGLQLLVLRGHIGTVGAVAFNHDGSVLATCSHGQFGTDNSIKLWETQIDPARALRRTNTAIARSAVGPKVDALFKTYVRLSDVRAQIDLLEGMSAAERGAASRLADFQGDDPAYLWREAWRVVRYPGRTAREYGDALQRVELALGLVTEGWPTRSSIVLTHALALYRTGELEDSAAVLNGIKPDLEHSGFRPLIVGRNVAVRAIVASGQGDPEAARVALQELREHVGDPKHHFENEIVRMLREAEAGVQGTALPEPPP